LFICCCCCCCCEFLNFVPKDTWLFDIENDPEEKYDLSEQYPDVVKRLKARLELEHSEAVDPLPDRWASMIAG
jgi:arylsulfatase A-like enzyme